MPLPSSTSAHAGAQAHKQQSGPRTKDCPGREREDAAGHEEDGEQDVDAAEQGGAVHRAQLLRELLHGVKPPLRVMAARVQDRAAG